MADKKGFLNRIFALMLTLCVAGAAFLFWGVQTHAENEIPAYSGNASVELNKNVPDFTADEITTSSLKNMESLMSWGDARLR